MTTFSNQRRMAAAQNVAGEIAIKGDFQMNADNRISNFNGQVVKGTAYVGYFNFAERPDGNISINVDNVPMSDLVAAQNLVLATVTDIHTEFDVELTEEESGDEEN